MQVSRTIEVRWFLPGGLPAEVGAWFDALGPSVDAEARTDRYLVPASDAVGVKLREGAVEPKRLGEDLGVRSWGRSEGRVGTWTKWSFPRIRADDQPADSDDGWVSVRKVRRRRPAWVGDAVCALEVAEVTVRGETWGSVCLEAAGPTTAARRAAFDAGADWLRRDDAPALAADAAMGYPAWLRRVLG